ncbi:F-box domain-containing protein [Mycena chlorophos]|uniref:F-box domain-containing protein n=1 Tax=Mycena chlorophos TaxID=658473 RepID=A0A8H6TL90_MYCCL|nr:F-box domain-containing protein [Mycena chlorophos]
MTSDEPKPSAASLRNALVQVDEEIEEWNAHLLQLQQKRAGICTRLDAVVYPVLSLPVEITTEIFKHYVAGVVVWVGGSNSGRGPWVLAAVCRAWRAIALHVPALWADMCLQGSSSASQHEKTKQMLESYLSRSA